MQTARLLNAMLLGIGLLTPGIAQDSPQPKWSYRPELLSPFWEGDTVDGESVLFIRDDMTGEARASVLLPIRELLTVRNSAGDVTYENGKDFVWKPDSREIMLPAGSRIPSRTPQELRRPAKTQKYELTHRDGNGEIYFGARLEYAEMFAKGVEHFQRCDWQAAMDAFDACRKRRPDDLAAENYLEETVRFQKTPPAADWTGAIELQEK